MKCHRSSQPKQPLDEPELDAELLRWASEGGYLPPEDDDDTDALRSMKGEDE